jgi:hypothetical protein
VSGTFSPIATGDFDEDGKGDIFWYQPGGPTSVWWFQ